MSIRDELMPLFERHGMVREDVLRMSEEEFVGVLDMILEAGVEGGVEGGRGVEERSERSERRERWERWQDRTERLEQDEEFRRLESDEEMMDRVRAWRVSQGMNEEGGAREEWKGGEGVRGVRGVMGVRGVRGARGVKGVKGVKRVEEVWRCGNEMRGEVERGEEDEFMARLKAWRRSRGLGESESEGEGQGEGGGEGDGEGEGEGGDGDGDGGWGGSGGGSGGDGSERVGKEENEGKGENGEEEEEEEEDQAEEGEGEECREPARGGVRVAIRSPETGRVERRFEESGVGREVYRWAQRASSGRLKRGEFDLVVPGTNGILERRRTLWEQGVRGRVVLTAMNRGEGGGSAQA
jgi:hypothetical protein